MQQENGTLKKQAQKLKEQFMQQKVRRIPHILITAAPWRKEYKAVVVEFPVLCVVYLNQ